MFGVCKRGVAGEFRELILKPERCLGEKEGSLRGKSTFGVCYRKAFHVKFVLGLFQTSFVPGLRTSCGPNWYTGGSNNNSYILALFVACFVLPLGLILFSYTNLLMTLRAVSAAGPLHSQPGSRVQVLGLQFCGVL